VTRVLVIDDLQGCRQLLEDAGVDNIVEAQSLADGFRLYRVQRPDVIIVDLATRTGALGGLSFNPPASPSRSAHTGSCVHHA